jgi:DNA polymerase-3 subunit alpha
MRYTQQEYLKSEEEMAEMFYDHLETLSNTLEVADKIESYKVDKHPLHRQQEIADSQSFT